MKIRTTNEIRVNNEYGEKGFENNTKWVSVDDLEKSMDFLVKDLQTYKDTNEDRNIGVCVFYFKLKELLGGD
jgi:hypothetical protein